MVNKVSIFLTILCVAHLVHSKISSSACYEEDGGFSKFVELYKKRYTSVQAEFEAKKNLGACCDNILRLEAASNNRYSLSINENCDIQMNFLINNNLKFPQVSHPLRDQDIKKTEQSFFKKLGNIVGASTCPPNHQSKASSVKNQGQCGSCWTFATTAAYESALKRVQGKTYDLSEQYVLECTDVNNSTSRALLSGCQGGVIDYALEVITKTGQPLETSAPYAASAYTGSTYPNTISNCSNTLNFKKLIFPVNQSNAISYRYNNVSSASIATLLQRGSLVAGIYADSGFGIYSGGVFSCSVNFTTAYSKINHAVELVGMDCNGNYIIKNSWGTSWGNAGFATVSAANDCGLSAYVYSILSETMRLVTYAVVAVGVIGMI